MKPTRFHHLPSLYRYWIDTLKVYSYSLQNIYKWYKVSLNHLILISFIYFFTGLEGWYKLSSRWRMTDEAEEDGWSKTILFAPGKLNRGEEQRVNLLVTERIVKYVNMTEYKGLQFSHNCELLFSWLRLSLW